jgi:L-alanine-DL-glutamate epimerase-like enolase superfamily enzyme
VISFGCGYAALSSSVSNKIFGCGPAVLWIAMTAFTERTALIVRVKTDDGLTEIGENLVRSAARAAKCLGKDMLAALIRGMDPTDMGKKGRGDVCLLARNNTGKSLLECPVEGSGIFFV